MKVAYQFLFSPVHSEGKAELRICYLDSDVHIGLKYIFNMEHVWFYILPSDVDLEPH